MLRPPAFPSTPPPPNSEVRPLRYVDAVLWTGGITLLFLWLLFLSSALRESALRDPVTASICQLVAYLLGLFLMLRAHAPERRIRDFVAFKSAHPGFYGLAIVAGVALAFPGNWLVVEIYTRFPPAEPIPDLFDGASHLDIGALALATVVAIPLVEEMIFRGALFGGLLRHAAHAHPRRRIALPVVVTSALFAAVHMQWRIMLAAFLVGLVLGQLRVASRSMVPPLLLHAAANTVPFMMFATQTDAAVSTSLALGGLVVTAVCVGGIHMLGCHIRAMAPPSSRPPASHAAPPSS